MLKAIPFLVVLFVLSIVPFSTAQAEDTTHISELNVSVWPEYDQPGVLVQYQGKIADAGTSGAEREITVLVPKGAGVGAACGIKSDGSHTSETWKESDSGDGFTAVTYKENEAEFHVEFYYNPLVGSPDKTMEFTYKAASPVDDLFLDVQHPLKATNFVLVPDAPQSHTDTDGFTYHVYEQKQVVAGQTISSKISYTKSDPNPSVSGQTSTSAGSNNQAAPSDGLNPNVVVVLAGLFAAAVLIGYFTLVRRPQPQFAPVRVNQAQGELRPMSGGFCTECGSPVEAGDRFCGNCGTKRRTGDSQ